MNRLRLYCDLICTQVSYFADWLWFWAPVLLLLAGTVSIVVYTQTGPRCHMPGVDVVTPEDYRLCVPAYDNDKCLEKLGYAKICE